LAEAHVAVVHAPVRGRKTETTGWRCRVVYQHDGPEELVARRSPGSIHLHKRRGLWS
jgi:hypothetical protein